MKLTSSLPALVVLAALLAVPAPTAAQNREHQQLAADFQMLQEQVRKIQLAINMLATQVNSTNERLDQQDAAMRKGFADQQYVIDALDETLTTLREKLNDNTVRVGQLMQEMDTIRQGIEVLQTLLNQIIVQLTPPPTPAGADPNVPVDPERAAERPTTPPIDPSGAAAGAGAGAGAAPPPTLPPTETRVLPPSPSAAYQYAFGQLYANGDHALAIEAFRDFLTQFPTAADAPKAQFFMGESLFYLGRYKEAIDAYVKMVDTYPESELVPDAYFKQGVCYQSLRQNPDARRVYELILAKFPDSNAAINATIRLKDMGGGGVSG